MHVFLHLYFSYSSGFPFIGSPYRCRVWRNINASLILLYNYISKYIFLSIDVTFGKLENAKSVTSVYQETAGLNTLADENWKNILKLITVKPRYNATSNIAHTTLWTAFPSYTLCRFTGLKFQWTNSGYCEPTWYCNLLRWSSSCFPQDVHIWQQDNEGRSHHHWGNGRARTTDLSTVRTRNVWHTSGEWNFLIVTACNFNKLYLLSLNTFRVLNPLLMNM